MLIILLTYQLIEMSSRIWIYLKHLFELERNVIPKLTPETPTAAQIVICNFPAVLQTYF